MDLDKNIEIETPLPIFKKSENFPEGHTSNNLVKVTVPPTNNNSEFDNIHNIIQFDVPCTFNALDPKQLFFEGDIVNLDSFAKEIDHSFHSLIKKIVVYNGIGEQLEIIEDYDFLMTLHFDMTLSRSERLRRQKNEGFGVNKYGTDSAILWGKTETADNFQSTKEVLQQINTHLSAKILSPLDISNNDPNKLPPLIDKKNDVFNPKNSIQLLNTWDVVENGVLLPKPTVKSKIEKGILHFKIPLMLRSIGAWYEKSREEDEYRLIPLGIFKGGLKILIFLNPTAFSVMVNVKEFELLDMGTDLKVFKNENIKSRKDFFLNQVPDGHENPRRYNLRNANINMTQYKLDKSQHTQLINAMDNDLYRRVFNDTEILNTLYLKPYPVLQYTNCLSKKHVQRILITFTSDMYKKSYFARQHDRFNKGIQSIVFKLNGEVYPKPTLTRYNSLNTVGEQNCNFFYAELRKGIQKHAYEQDYFLTKTNFAINRNTSYDYALQHLQSKKLLKIEIPSSQTLNPFDKKSRDEYKNEIAFNLQYNEMIPIEYDYLRLKKITHLNNFIDPVASKTIYALHLIDGENTYDGSGVECTPTCPFTLEVSRLDRVDEEDQYSKNPEITFFMTIMIQYWSAVKLTSEGKTFYS